jgi:eukaryotic-like serine/threonine-protein kinase
MSGKGVAQASHRSVRDAGSDASLPRSHSGCPTVPASVPPTDRNDPQATRSASPSSAEPASANHPQPGAGRVYPRPSAAAQLRDPDRYQIINEHGRGGLGRVSRAHDLDLGRDVAIKELITRGNLSEVRFLREALITARLEHPGIVPVHEAGRWPDGTPFYAMKLVAGRPLRDLIAERTTVTERIGLLHHVIAVADAIAYAHGRNIIHRDLKPANVIVGDFGETIVIDWGLAKDLSTTEDVAVGDGPFRAHHDINLTSTGSVLGTPAYMAPEQERGEYVDQRADVFAIGAMLWELCSLQKVPPTDQRLRHRMLRRAGIDQDLVTIIDKALDPAPKHRYPNAGALAADLKAFKSGARIAARRYSLWALLAHWTRRHLALAASVSGVLVLVSTGAIFYVRSVTAERDRADMSEESARRARASAEDSLDQLTLKHAQLLLTKDPSAAIDVLLPYHGADIDRANQIRAEAKGRGVSLLRAAPHTGMIRWMEGTSDGSIVSLGTDGTISRTSPQGTSIVLSHNVARFAQLSYSNVRHLLAYACDPSDLCIYDILNDSGVRSHPVFQGLHPLGISFSEDGQFLAVMSQDTTLRVIDVTTPSQPTLRLIKKIRGGSDAVFFSKDIVVAGTPNSIEFVHMNGISEPFSIPDNSFWDANFERREFAIATIKGQALLFSGPPMRLVAHIELCNGPVAGLKFIPHRQEIAFGCREGHIGLWDAQHKIVISKTRVEAHADLVTVDPTGEYIVAAAGNGTVTILDLYSNFVTSYRGHESRVTAVTPPSRSYPFFISADMKGTLRTWPLPVRFARVATTLNSQFNTDIFDKQSGSVIATTYLPTLTTFSPTTGIRSFGPHDPYNFSLVQSSNGNTFVAYGLNELVEFWSAATMTRTNVLNTKQGSLSQVSFVENTDDVITSGHDGRLIRWTSSGVEKPLAQLDQPIDVFALLPADVANMHGSVVFSSFDGALWHTMENGQPIRFKHGDARVSRMLTLSDHRTVLAGTTKGEVVAINTKSWKYHIVLQTHDTVREISTTRDGRWIVVGTNDGSIHVATLPEGVSDPETASWQRLTVRARRHSVTSDGLLIAVCSDGVIWLYAISEQRWLCLPVGDADFRWIATSATGDAAAALDVEGRLIWIDLDTARKLLTGKQSH